MVEEATIREIDELEPLGREVMEALREVRDPELGMNIVDLGLVYNVEIEDDEALVTMTLTSPGCPAGGEILENSQKQAESIDGIDSADIDLVWKPFWSPDRIDDEVRATLGI